MLAQHRASVYLGCLWFPQCIKSCFRTVNRRNCSSSCLNCFDPYKILILLFSRLIIIITFVSTSVRYTIQSHRHDASARRWRDVGPTSKALDQYWASVQPVYFGCCGSINSEIMEASPADASHWIGVESVLNQRLGRWPSIDSTPVSMSRTDACM